MAASLSVDLRRRVAAMPLQRVLMNTGAPYQSAFDVRCAHDSSAKADSA
jgi:hypothetical protein